MQLMLFIVQLIARSLPNIANNLEICNLPAFVVGALMIKRFPRLRIVRRRLRRHPRQKIQQQHGGKDPDPEFLLHPHTLLEIIYFSPLWHTHQKYNMPRRETQQQKNSRPMRDDCFYWCARGDLPAVRGGVSRLWSAPGAPFGKTYLRAFSIHRSRTKIIGVNGMLIQKREK